DGEMVRASEAHDADLFWALRGGGGNFGVVTTFEYRLHPVGPTVLAGPIFWPMEDTVDVLRFYREFVAAAPDDLTTIVNVRKAPALPVVPPELHERPVCVIATRWAGPVGKGEEPLAPLRAFGRPLLDLLGPPPHRANQSIVH